MSITRMVSSSSSHGILDNDLSTTMGDGPGWHIGGYGDDGDASIAIVSISLAPTPSAIYN